MANNTRMPLQAAAALLAVGLLATAAFSQDRRAPENPYTAPQERAPAPRVPERPGIQAVDRTKLPWYNPIEEITGYGDQGFYQRANGIPGVGALGPLGLSNIAPDGLGPRIGLQALRGVRAAGARRTNGNSITPAEVWRALGNSNPPPLRYVPDQGNIRSGPRLAPER